MPAQDSASQGKRQQVRLFGPARGGAAIPATLPSATAPPATLAPATLVSAASGTSAGLTLSQANACTACHGIASKVVGPGLQEISKKYAGPDDLVDYLGAKITQGGQGAWGAIPKPGQAQLKEADAKSLAGRIATSAP